MIKPQPLPEKIQELPDNSVINFITIEKDNLVKEERRRDTGEKKGRVTVIRKTN